MTKKNKLESPEIYERQAEICSALSHPVRLQIVDLLQGEKELSCTEMLEYINIPKTNLSQHLSKLKRAKLVGVRKEGLFQFHFLLIPEIKKACSMVREVLYSLPERQARLLFLRHAGLSYNELANALDVAPGSVGTLLARAHAAFADAFQEAAAGPAGGNNDDT